MHFRKYMQSIFSLFLSEIKNAKYPKLQKSKNNFNSPAAGLSLSCVIFQIQIIYGNSLGDRIKKYPPNLAEREKVAFKPSTLIKTHAKLNP